MKGEARQGGGDQGRLEGRPLHILHGTGYGGGPADSEYHVDEGTLVGQYEVIYDDKTTQATPGGLRRRRTQLVDQRGR